MSTEYRNPDRPLTEAEIKEMAELLAYFRAEYEKLTADNAALRAQLTRLARPFYPEEGATVQDENTRLRAENAALQSKVANQADRIRYLEGATNHATGTPLSQMRKRAEKAEADNAALRAQVEWKPVTDTAPEDDRHVLVVSDDQDGEWWDFWVGYRSSGVWYAIPYYNATEAVPKYWMPKEFLLQARAGLEGGGQ